VLITYSAELQGEWIVKMMNDLKKSNKKSIVANLDAEKKWGEDTWKFADATLLTKTRSVSFGPPIIRQIC
jgi:hypothetical protein